MGRIDDNKNILILISLGLFIRVIAYPHTCLIALDGAFQYIPAAKLYAGGDFKEALNQLQAPLYPLLIGLLSRLGFPLEPAGRLISLVLGTLAIVPLYLLGNRLFKNSGISFLAGLLFAVHPYLVRFSVDVLKETSYIFFLVTSLWLVWEALASKKLWLHLLAGTAIGLACLTRADGVEIFILAGIWIIISETLEPGKKYRRIIVSLCFLSIFSFSLVAPYMWHIKQTTGEWNLSKKKKIEVLVGKENIGSGDNTNAVPTIRRYAGGFLVLVSKSVKSFHPPLLILLIFGLIKRKVIPYQRKEELFLASFFVFHLVLLYMIAVNYNVFHNGYPVLHTLSSRHALPMVVVSFFWMGMGILEIRGRIYGWMISGKNGSRSPNLSRNILIIILAVIILGILPKTLKPQREDKLGHKIAGTWIKEHSLIEVPVIATNLPRVSYYAEGKLIRLSKISPDEIDSLKKMKANFLVIGDRGHGLPDFLKAWQTIFQYKERKGGRVMVYRLPSGKQTGPTR